MILLFFFALAVGAPLGGAALLTRRSRLAQAISRPGSVLLVVLFSGAVSVTPPVAIAQTHFLTPPAMSVDSLLQSDWTNWEQAHSAHFVLYTKAGASYPSSRVAVLDSLEEAWTHDLALLGAKNLEGPPISAVIIDSWSSFPMMVAPSTRGFMRLERNGGQLIVLVYNNEIRLFSRHEVMHAVSYRFWGGPGAAWVDEGLATFADGRCQGTTVLAVARDLLRAEPEFTAADLDARYRTSAGPVLGRRLRAYVLAASMVSFAYAYGGLEAVRLLRRDGITALTTWVPTDSLTKKWRKYVQRAAAGERGLSSEAIDAHGCG